MVEDRYVIADDESSLWGHLFGPGTNETTTRFVFDRERDALVSAEYLSGKAWIPMDSLMWDNFTDHLVNANPGALETPSDWGLRTSSELPDWTQSASPSP